MGRMPHGVWDVGWGTANWPAILLAGFVGPILLAVVIAALTRKKKGDISLRVPEVDVFEANRRPCSSSSCPV
jgi:hypothetical protein